MATKTETTTEPTLEDVGVMESRLANLEEEADEFAARDEALSQQIADAHAGVRTKEDLTSLTQQRREARDGKCDVLEAVTALQRRITADRELASTAAAAKRLKEINKAYGGLRKVLENDEEAAQAAAKEYEAKAVRVNERFLTLAMLRAEAEALGNRFPDVPGGPRFPSITVPALRPVCIEAARVVHGVAFRDHGHIAKPMQKCEHQLRSRRSYREVAGTPGAAIIEVAGLSPWPALTDAQRATVAGHERDVEEEARDAARFAEASDRLAPPRTDIVGPLPHKGAGVAAR